MTSPKNEVQVVGERSSDDAIATAEAYESIGLEQVEKFGTVVLAYTKDPIDAESGRRHGILDMSQFKTPALPVAPNAQLSLF